MMKIEFHVDRLLNTIRQGDFYLITEDFESCKLLRYLITISYL